MSSSPATLLGSSLYTQCAQNYCILGQDARYNVHISKGEEAVADVESVEDGFFLLFVGNIPGTFIVG